MATPKTRWVLSILVISVSAVAPGPPVPPSNPECFRPCDETGCQVDIQCTWDSNPDPEIPTNYTLHWEPANSKNEDVYGGTSLNGHILRQDFSGEGELRVWVEASNQYGSAKSQEVVFNAGDITKPPPPVIIATEQEPLEITWNDSCIELESSGSCDIRYRKEEDEDWPQQENGVQGSYTVVDTEPFAVYEFQVRCTCGTGLASAWSEIYRIRSAESDPVGEVDVWRDCGISPTSSDCVLTWKNLSISQARGFILGYELRLSYSSGPASLINVSTTEPSSQYVHDKMKWHLTYPLKDVSSVSISAYSTLGATKPSVLVIPSAGKEEDAVILNLKMNEENLTVSWDPPSQVSDDLRYVVQYKQAGCPPGQGFDWIRVNKSQEKAFFQGQFQKYKAYKVSVFTVSNTNEVRHLSSAIGYSLQKAPSTVHLFKVASIADTSVTLSWEHGPLPEQTARILYYQIVLDTQKVYNVSLYPNHQSMTFTLSELSQSQDYEVWIRAVTEAGPGANVSTRFTTKHSQNLGFLLSLVSTFASVIFCVCIAYTLLSVCRGPSKACPLMPLCVYEKVPDPRNSHIFKQKKNQFNEPLGLTCSPFCEPQPKISLLEVVKIKSQDLNPEPVAGDKCSQMDSYDAQRKDAVAEESERIDRRYGREAYSKMVDSDEETGDGDNSEEEQFTSGYEKHFMPSPFDIL
ncbi:interleukin 12 receptor, beta 2a, like [Archocentrus centrarchus]|uniref:interleukin 12 receptor, beta 2a, like n=1 Tax=Archocentrus centrarchus TaxID=63155 RepID=UPI0011E9B999|nr:interleukin-6 receptor subunit beta-like [Archocentrus centrarchus]